MDMIYVHNYRHDLYPYTLRTYPILFGILKYRLRKLGIACIEMPKIAKEFYEGKALLKPRSKTNPTGVKKEELATIESVSLTKLPNTGDTYVEKFKEHEESLPLNKTNVKAQVDLFGDDTDKWIGEQVKLIVILANNPKTGKEVLTVRVKPKDWEYGDEEES